MQNTELVTYIQAELQKGVLPETIHEVLLQTGWQAEDIYTAFVSAQGEGVKKTPRDWNKIWLWGVPAIFVAGSFLAYITGEEDIVMIWFPTVGLGLLVVLGYFVMAILRRKWSYARDAFLMLLIFGIVGAGTCVLNLGII
jgi:hypothetical protein